jgi:hypothetical protein
MFPSIFCFDEGIEYLQVEYPLNRFLCPILTHPKLSTDKTIVLADLQRLKVAFPPASALPQQPLSRAAKRRCPAYVTKEIE